MKLKMLAHPTYVNDPYDPVRVLFTEEVPEVPGYAPVKNTISVNDPFTDTKVAYTLKATLIPVNSEHPYRPIKPTCIASQLKKKLNIRELETRPKLLEFRVLIDENFDSP